MNEGKPSIQCCHEGVTVILMPGLSEPSCVFFLGSLYTFLPASLSQLSKEYSEAALSEKKQIQEMKFDKNLAYFYIFNCILQVAQQ